MNPLAQPLAVPRALRRPREHPGEGQTGQQEGSGDQGVVKQEGGVQSDVVGTTASEDGPSFSFLLILLNTIDIDSGGSGERQEAQEKARR